MTEQERLLLLQQQGGTNTTNTELSSALAKPATAAPASTKVEGYTDEDIKSYVQQAQSAAVPQASASPAMDSLSATTPAAASSALTLPGVSDATNRALSDLINNGYVPSAAVEAALGELNRIIANQPAGFSSQYSAQLQAIMAQILARDDFSYDANTDATYQQYKDQYQQAGKTAMMDTTGRAAQLTGGYGNSYAATAGNQAYQGYLTKLNDVLPELQQQALAQYQAEGDEMQAAYGLASDAYNRDQSAYQDAYNAWLAQRDYAAGRADNERNLDYNNYQNQMEMWYNVAQQENAQYNANRQQAYSTAMAMLSAGQMPSAEMLAAAGISQADAKTIYNANKASSGGSGRSRTSSSSGSSSGSASTSTPKTTPSSTISDAAASAKARQAYAAWSKSGKMPDWSSYSAADRAKLNRAFRALRESTV